MAASAFAGAVRAASGQWEATRSVYAFIEAGTGAGWSGRLTWVEVNRKGKEREVVVIEDEACSEFSLEWPVFDLSSRERRNSWTLADLGFPPVSSSLPARSRSAPWKQSRRTRVRVRVARGRQKSSTKARICHSQPLTLRCYLIFLNFRGYGSRMGANSIHGKFLVSYLGRGMRFRQVCRGCACLVPSVPEQRELKRDRSEGLPSLWRLLWRLEIIQIRF